MIILYKKYWSKFYRDVEEELPPEIIEPLGKDFITELFVYSDHAGDKKNRRS